MKSSGLKPAHLNRHHSPQHGDHLVHFFDKTDTLEQAFCQYAIPGISRGEGIVVIATEEHSQAFQSALSNRSIDVARVISRGQLVIIDAHETLLKIMKDKRPDKAVFEYEVQLLLTTMKRKYSTIRAYGEMVNILCQDGNHEGAIELEKLWEGLIQTEPLSLFCGYHSGGFHEHHETYFNKVCSTHTHVVVSDGVIKVR